MKNEVPKKHGFPDGPARPGSGHSAGAPKSTLISKKAIALKENEPKKNKREGHLLKKKSTCRKTTEREREPYRRAPPEGNLAEGKVGGEVLR